jgi:hypothetical protein
MRATCPDRFVVGFSDLRAKTNLSSRIKVISVVQSPSQKFLYSLLTQITSISRASRPFGGAFRHRHERWAGDAVDAEHSPLPPWGSPTPSLGGAIDATTRARIAPRECESVFDGRHPGFNFLSSFPDVQLHI